MSVIVPFFNVERYAAENLASLAQNAAPGVEFVLVDDGSTDATSTIVGAGAERLPQAQLISPAEELRTLGSPKCGPVGGPRTLSELPRWRRCRGSGPLSGAAFGDRTAGLRLRPHRPCPSPRPTAVAAFDQSRATWGSLPSPLGHRPGWAAQLSRCSICMGWDLPSAAAGCRTAGLPRGSTHV